MSSIWFNPELNEYQCGSLSLLEELRGKSNTPDAFTTLFTFNPTSERLKEKVFEALIRNMEKINASVAH